MSDPRDEFAENRVPVLQCDCGAQLPFGNLAKKGEEPVFFVGFWQKPGVGTIRETNPYTDQRKRQCLWCRKELPKNVQEAFQKWSVG